MAAKRAKMARTNYVNYERGNNQPGAASLVRLAKAVGVPAHELSKIDPAEATLRDLREWAGLSQAEVAKAAGWSAHSGYSFVEAGKFDLGEHHVKPLARLFGTTMSAVRAAADRSVQQ